MKQLISAFFGFLALVTLSGAGRAAPIETRGEYAVLMDADSGAILFEKNADTLMAPASMSKLMTTAVLFHQLKQGNLALDDTFHVSKKAWRMGGSKMYVLVDTDIRIEDLIQGIVVQSGNDACVVVAEGISGTEDAFAKEMTRYAREIGMKKSIFANATGWPDPGQKMTARELAILARKIITDFPEYYHYFSEKEFTWSDITQPNRNPVLYADIGADGLKTGHTEESGYGLVASAVQDGRRLILVVNGLSSEHERSTEAQRLLRIGFREFKPYDLYQGGQIVGKADVWQGARSDVDLEIRDPLKVILRKSDRRRMKVSINYVGPVVAPIEKGKQVAELRVTTPDGPQIVRPLYAAEDVEKLGLLGRLWDAVVHLVKVRLAPSA